MMAQEYKRRGGDYKTDKSEKDESQKNLSNWTDEEWQTKDGSANAKKEDGTQQRYLPKKAWENLSEEEKKQTDDKKQAESKEGKQYVANTDKAKESRKKSQKGSKDGEEDIEESDQEETQEQETERQDSGVEKEDDEESEDEEYSYDENEDEEDDENAGNKENGKSKTRGRAGQKRKSEQTDEQTSKKQKHDSGNAKTVGSKHMPADEPAPRGSNDRLPKKGEQITWKAMPGYVEGEVMEILHKDKTVDGKSVKASEDDPKIVLKSKSSGKVSPTITPDNRPVECVLLTGNHYRSVSTNRVRASMIDSLDMKWQIGFSAEVTLS